MSRLSFKSCTLCDWYCKFVLDVPCKQESASSACVECLLDSPLWFSQETVMHIFSVFVFFQTVPCLTVVIKVCCIPKTIRRACRYHSKEHCYHEVLIGISYMHR